jgi:hypothetical protein
MLIALMLAGCAGPEFRTVCQLPPLTVTVFSSEIPNGSVDIWTGRKVEISGWQERDGKVIDFYVAGHELQHLLQYHCPGFVNPDRR